MTSIVRLSLTFLLAANGFASSKQGSFEYDLAFIKQYEQPVVLENGEARIIVSPRWQGRILTSGTSHSNARSYGWLNHEAIANGKGNPGGEDRLWLGPIGSQFSLFFPHGSEIVDETWRVPSPIASQPFNLISRGATYALFSASMVLENHIGQPFATDITRLVQLFSRHEIESTLQIRIPSSLTSVGFESVQKLVNTGEDWSLDTGVLTLWCLGMFNGGDQITTVFPYVKAAARPIELNTFLYPLDTSRLRITDQTIFYKGDGRYRSKIGIRPRNTKTIFGSYDAENEILTIVKFSFANDTQYTNNHRGHQDEPYDGDVINSYNDGPMDGSTGKKATFYELESASPAKALKQGESITHIHQTFHFEGDEAKLNALSKALLGLGLEEIQNALQ